jgi:hypothetical protein
MASMYPSLEIIVADMTRTLSDNILNAETITITAHEGDDGYCVALFGWQRKEARDDDGDERP